MSWGGGRLWEFGGGHQNSIGTLHGGGGALKTYFNNRSGLEKYFNELTLGPLKEVIDKFLLKSERFSAFNKLKLRN